MAQRRHQSQRGPPRRRRNRPGTPLDAAALAEALAEGGYEIKTSEQGAATSVLVATSPQLEGVGGRYFADCNEAPVVGPDVSSAPRGLGLARYALDPTDARRLWEQSLDLIRSTA